jgi:hypothetical protein
LAYVAASGTVVLFGGDATTWTWNGTTWTEQHPATSPPARELPYMAYDAATSTVVLFGGAVAPRQCPVGDTWTWNGTTWTEQAPAHHPSARSGGAMVYDAATGNVVLFGGFEMYRPCNANFEYFHQTWTWG